MADDPENPDPSAPVSTTDHPNQDAAGAKAKSQTTQGGRSAKVSPGGPKRQNFMTQLIGMDELRPMMEFIRQCEAEFWGTLFLVFFGTGACCNWIRGPGGSPVGNSPTLVSISLAFGLAVATIAQMLGHISGAHLNPAVTFGLVARGNVGLIKAGIFFFVQIFGALFGSLIFYGIMPSFVPDANGAPISGRPGLQSTIGIAGAVSNLGSGVAAWQGILNEIFITFPLIFVICAVCDPGHEVKGSAPLAIGLAIALGHLVGIPASGASMNPGPLIVSLILPPSDDQVKLKKVDTGLEAIYVYILGPIIGGVLAGIYYRFRFASERLARNQGGPPVQITQTQMLAPQSESQAQMSQSHHTQSSHPPQH